MTRLRFTLKYLKLLKKSLLIVFLIFNLNLNAQLKNVAYQLYLYDKIYNSTDTIGTLSDFLALEHSTKIRQTYIVNLQNEIIKAQNQIKQLNLAILQLNNDLKLAKTNFAKLITFLYLSKKFVVSPIIFIFSASSLHQAFLRYNYLKIISLYLKNLTKTILILKQELTNKKLLLQKKINLKNQLIEQLQQQKNIQQKYLNQQYKIFKNLEQKEDNLRLSLNKIVASYELIQEYIQEFENAPVNDTSLTQKFEQRKGKLLVPLNNALIISSFGVHRHTKLKNITIKNDGIDLASNNDTLVKNVFDGRVVAVIALPTNARAVIIKHGDYFTVYNNLNIVYVIKNQIVFSGQIIGTISKKTSNYSFASLNFQIWKKNKKLNPAKWLNIS